MKIHEIIYNIDMVDSVARDLLEILPLVSILTFSGPLGVGKTTLIGAILKQAGIDCEVVSPTFTYLNIYNNACDQTFYHFDLYRLTSKQDFLEAGFDEYLYLSKSWSLIEWPELIMPLIQHKVCHFSLDYHGENRRILRYSIRQDGEEKICI